MEQSQREGIKSGEITLKAEKMFNWMLTSTFERWYEGPFLAYVHGDEDAPPKEDLLKEIEYFLG